MRRAKSSVSCAIAAICIGSTPWSLREPKNTTSASSGCTARLVRSSKTLPWSPRTTYPARPSEATSGATWTPCRDSVDHVRLVHVFESPTAFVGAGRVGVPDHRDVVDRCATGDRLEALRRGRTVRDQSGRNSGRDNSCGHPPHRDLHCPPPRPRVTSYKRNRKSTTLNFTVDALTSGTAWKPFGADEAALVSTNAGLSGLAPQGYYLINVRRNIARVTRRASAGAGRNGRRSSSVISVDRLQFAARYRLVRIAGVDDGPPSSTILRIQRRAGSSTT